jgi:hypothetical protein
LFYVLVTMTRPLLPPNGFYIPRSILFNHKFPPALRDTLMHLISLAWANNGRSTPPVSYAQLSQILDKSPRTLYGQIACLRTVHAALRLQNAGNGLFIIHFAEWVQPRKKSSPDLRNFLQSPDQEVEDVSLSTGKEKHPLPNDVNHGAQNLQKSGKTPRRLSKKLVAALEEAGIFAPMIEEAAASDYSEKDLWALLAWVKEECPQKPGGIFVYRMRSRSHPPARFFQTSCPECGRRGEHAPDCPARFRDGEFADFYDN